MKIAFPYTPNVTYMQYIKFYNKYQVSRTKKIASIGNLHFHISPNVIILCELWIVNRKIILFYTLSLWEFYERWSDETVWASIEMKFLVVNYKMVTTKYNNNMYEKRICCSTYTFVRELMILETTTAKFRT